MKKMGSKSKSAERVAPTFERRYRAGRRVSEDTGALGLDEDRLGIPDTA